MSPYLSVWCALDDMNEENGCLYILPYRSGRELPNPALHFSSPQHLLDFHLRMAQQYPAGLLGGKVLLITGQMKAERLSTTFQNQVRLTVSSRCLWKEAAWLSYPCLCTTEVVPIYQTSLDGLTCHNSAGDLFSPLLKMWPLLCLYLGWRQDNRNKANTRT